jgi:hypothetical protein
MLRFVIRLSVCSVFLSRPAIGAYMYDRSLSTPLSVCMTVHLYVWQYSFECMHDSTPLSVCMYDSSLSTPLSVCITVPSVRLWVYVPQYTLNVCMTVHSVHLWVQFMHRYIRPSVAITLRIQVVMVVAIRWLIKYRHFLSMSSLLDHWHCFGFFSIRFWSLQSTHPAYLPTSTLVIGKLLT